MGTVAVFLVPWASLSSMQTPMGSVTTSLFPAVLGGKVPHPIAWRGYCHCLLISLCDLMRVAHDSRMVLIP